MKHHSDDPFADYHDISRHEESAWERIYEELPFLGQIIKALRAIFGHKDERG